LNRTRARKISFLRFHSALKNIKHAAKLLLLALLLNPTSPEERGSHIALLLSSAADGAIRVALVTDHVALRQLGIDALQRGAVVDERGDVDMLLRLAICRCICCVETHRKHFLLLWQPMDAFVQCVLNGETQDDAVLRDFLPKDSKEVYESGFTYWGRIVEDFCYEVQAPNENIAFAFFNIERGVEDWEFFFEGVQVLFPKLQWLCVQQNYSASLSDDDSKSFKSFAHQVAKLFTELTTLNLFVIEDCQSKHIGIQWFHETASDWTHLLADCKRPITAVLRTFHPPQSFNVVQYDGKHASVRHGRPTSS
jgi:hypothetical protein